MSPSQRTYSDNSQQSYSQVTGQQKMAEQTASQSASSCVSGGSYSKGSIGSQGGAAASCTDRTENWADS